MVEVLRENCQVIEEAEEKCVAETVTAKSIFVPGVKTAKIADVEITFQEKIDLTSESGATEHQLYKATVRQAGKEFVGHQSVELLILIYLVLQIDEPIDNEYV